MKDKRAVKEVRRPTREELYMAFRRDYNRFAVNFAITQGTNDSPSFEEWAQQEKLEEQWIIDNFGEEALQQLLGVQGCVGHSHLNTYEVTQTRTWLVCAPSEEDAFIRVDHDWQKTREPNTTRWEVDGEYVASSKNTPPQEIPSDDIDIDDAFRLIDHLGRLMGSHHAVAPKVKLQIDTVARLLFLAGVTGAVIPPDLAIEMAGLLRGASNQLVSPSEA